ncbi:MAG: PCRF domain-containing protein, partial [Gemmatimonadota bacterium]|nr:PCRF domain-containing protein [Gemmatimonadota bacterium]
MNRSKRIAELEDLMTASDFWNNQERAREVIDEANRLKGWVEPWRAARDTAAEMGELAELLEEGEDQELSQEWESETARLERALDDLELRTMLQGDDDHREAMLTIHPGAGGLESQDWAEMLSRMYTRWAERR